MLKDAFKTDYPNDEFVAGSLCLDFVNTVDGREIGEREDRLTSYRDFVAWSKRADILTNREATRLLEIAATQTRQRRQVFQRALRLRENIYFAVSGYMSKKRVSVTSLAGVNEEMRLSLSRRILVARRRNYVLEWDDAPVLARPIWAIALSAVELLTNTDSFHLCRCNADDCDWLFVDRSKNQSRRWCDMKVCGNREKTKRYLRRR